MLCVLIVTVMFVLMPLVTGRTIYHGRSMRRSEDRSGGHVVVEPEPDGAAQDVTETNKEESLRGTRSRCSSARSLGGSGMCCR
ncbi:hypothetical protein EDB83DRAFT_2354609 [Lactarius deliciosus]|nr:hypothetical protein EDB83DRAFT_2354609 [Lactarius deliciosus]